MRNQPGPQMRVLEPGSADQPESDSACTPTRSDSRTPVKKPVHGQAASMRLRLIFKNKTYFSVNFPRLTWFETFSPFSRETISTKRCRLQDPAQPLLEVLLCILLWGGPGARTGPLPGCPSDAALPLIVCVA